MGKEYVNLKKQRCLQLVQECAHSGKSKREWCAENGIGYSTFMRWQKQLRDELAGELLVPPEIVPVPKWCSNRVQMGLGWRFLQLSRGSSRNSYEAA